MPKPPIDEPIYERADIALGTWQYEADRTISGTEYREGYPVRTGRILVHDKATGLARDVHKRVFLLVQPGYEARREAIEDALPQGDEGDHLPSMNDAQRNAEREKRRRGAIDAKENK